MAKPVRGGLRPAAGPGGLTSPDLVTAPHGPAPPGITPLRSPARFPDKPQNSKRRDAHARENCKIAILKPHFPKMITQSCAVDRG
jgi:hypothetical protein